MNPSFDRRDSEAEVFRAFAMACRAERDRISTAGLAAADRRFDTSAADRAVAGQLAALFIDSLARR